MQANGPEIDEDIFLALNDLSQELDAINLSPDYVANYQRPELPSGSITKECLVLTEKLSASGETDLYQEPFATPVKVINASNSELRG